ncbi:MAG: hypothetical protein HYX69_15095 [Planctomycetia bacterium]|nr:hypothetical protein [Planctomycetia bacterium]
MLSTINWVNRGDVSDGLTALFGANANQARLIVDRAILDWSEVIANFNYAGGGNTYNLTVNTADLDAIAQGGATSADAQKKPTAGTVTLDSVGTTHWVDPSVGDDAEFTTITNAFTGYAGPSLAGTDLYATMVHEIGHCLGFDQRTAYALSNFLTDTGVDDPYAADFGNLWAFNVGGGPIEATFTAADTGHTWEGPGIPLITGTLPWHPDDLMNPGRAIADNERNLISNFDATILRDAYGYSIVLPSTLNNMLVNPNFTTDALTVSGLPGSVDDVVLMLSAPGGFSVNVDGYTEIVPLSQTNSIAINTGAGTDVVLLLYNAARPTTVNGGGGGGDALFLPEGATVTSNTVTSSLINTVTYSNLESLNLSGSTGNDVFNVKSTFSLTPVTINGGDGEDTLYINPDSGALFGYGSAITWNGGGSVDKLQFEMQFSGFNDRYTVTSAAVQVQELNGVGSVTVNQIGYSSIDSVVVNAGSGNDEIILPDVAVKGTFSGAGGNDTFTVGGGNLGLSVNTSTLSGGPGTDTLVFDDSAYAGAVDWAVDDTGVFRETIGIQSYSYVGFEGVGIRLGAGGTRGNWLDVYDALYVNLAVTGGAGIDEVRLNTFSNVHQDGLGEVAYPMHFDGGGGLNSIVVNDQPRGMTTYELHPDRIKISELLVTDRADFTYAHVGSMLFNASDSRTLLYVYGTPSSIAAGQQITFLANGGNDDVTIYPHDAAGNLTVNGTLGIGGGTGSDALTVYDGAASSPITYRFQNLFGPGTTNIAGMGTANFGAGSDFENLFVYAGNGDDVFAIDSFKSGDTLALLGGGGNDTLDYGNGNLPVNITNVAALNFDGQGGYDAVNLNNANSSDGWQYTAASGSLQASRGFPAAAYLLTLGKANVEQVTVNAGPNADGLSLVSVAAGETLSFFGADGNDTISFLNSLAAVLGPVYFYGEGGTGSGNRMTSVFNSNTTGQTVHLDQASLGAFAGDNYWGPGGALYFYSVGDIFLAMGSGPDTVYAQPNLSATININGNNPTTAPGDTLNLALASAVNYVLTPTSASAGNVTSDNLKTLTYSGFETGPSVDDVAPYIVSQGYDDSGPVPTIFVEFSEDVSNALTVYYLELINTTVGEQVPPGLVELTYDAGTNTASFTFPGYEEGVLPSGDYTAKIYGTLTDLAGNPMGVETPFGFTVDTLGPRVVRVGVGATGWNATFRQQLVDSGLGTADSYAIPPGASQLTSLPWNGLNQVVIRFNEAVDIGVDDLAVNGTSVAVYGFVDFNYDADAFQATWTLSSRVGHDTLTLRLNGALATGIRDLTGNVLDGEWIEASDYPSGDGTAGGDFDFRFHVLPGDFNQDNIVDVSDIQQVAVNYLQGSAATLFVDGNGDGIVDVSEIQLVAANYLAAGGGAGALAASSETAGGHGASAIGSDHQLAASGGEAVVSDDAVAASLPPRTHSLFEEAASAGSRSSIPAPPSQATMVIQPSAVPRSLARRAALLICDRALVATKMEIVALADGPASVAAISSPMGGRLAPAINAPLSAALEEDIDESMDFIGGLLSADGAEGAGDAGDVLFDKAVLSLLEADYAWI